MVLKYFLVFTAIIIIVRSQNNHDEPCEEFTCDNGTECVEDNWTCDGEADCEDKSDEIKGCLQKYPPANIDANSYFHQEFAFSFENSTTCFECIRRFDHIRTHETITKYVGEEFTLQFNNVYNWTVAPVWRKSDTYLMPGCIIRGHRNEVLMCNDVNLQSSGRYIAEFRHPEIYVTKFYSQQFEVIVLEQKIENPVLNSTQSNEDNDSTDAKAEFEILNQEWPRSQKLVMPPCVCPELVPKMEEPDELVKEALKNLTPDQRKEAYKLITASISQYISTLNDGRDTEPSTEHPQTTVLPICQHNTFTIIL